MNKHFKHLSIVLAIVMLITSQFAFAFAADTDAAVACDIDVKAGDIVILYTNDMHCGIDNYPALADHKKDLEAITDYVTLVDAGDAIQGDTIGTLSKGEYLIDIMNNVGYEIAVPGNHEFDYGMDVFLELTKKAEFDYLCSNFVDLATGKAVLDAYKIVTYGDVKVAFVGIDTPESITKSTPAFFQDAEGNYIYGFCNDTTGEALYKNVQASVDAARAEGAEYVIAVGHLGIDEQSKPWTSKEVIANTTGIDALIDGHSHSVIPFEGVENKDGKQVVLTSTGTKLANVGQLVLAKNDLGKYVITSELVSLEGHETDADTTAFVDGIKAQYAELEATVVAKTDVALTIMGADGQRAVRDEETNLGDLCADAYRVLLGADVAFVNGGGVRTDIPAGDITYGQIIKVHPFGNMACLVEVTGQQILDALEFGARTTPSENGGFLQVSGLTYTIDTTVESTVETDELKNFVKVAGERRVKDVKVAGVAVDPAKTYTLASHNYMLKQGGDGFTMFEGSKILKDEVLVDNQVLINYIVDELGGVVGSEYAKAQGRITVLKTPFTDLKGYGWAEDFIADVYEKEIFNGTSATTFAPGKNMTNEMFITVLGRVSGEVEKPADGVKWSAPYVAWAKENKIVAEDIDLAADITREEMALYIYNMYNVLGKGPEGAWAIKLDYTDLADISEDCAEAVMFNTIKGFFGGYPDGTFKPAKTATRAEVSKVLVLVSEDLAKAETEN